LLKVNNLSTKYGDMQALFDVCFKVNEGEIVSIVGSNGSGKTTLLNTICGIIPNFQGEIIFCGENLKTWKSHDIVEAGIVQVPEGRLLFPYLSVLENLELGAFSNHARKYLKESMNTCLEYFPKLIERKGQLAGTLSGGEQQMLAISRALMGKPKLLMLDEPSMGLAPIIVKDMFETIKRINNDGISLLLVEQNVFQALNISDKAYVLENGRIVMSGSGSEILLNPDVKKAYLGI
jgi:branched-chain amino acid transport system ATP-binding protein